MIWQSCGQVQQRGPGLPQLLMSFKVVQCLIFMCGVLYGHALCTHAGQQCCHMCVAPRDRLR